MLLARISYNSDHFFCFSLFSLENTLKNKLLLLIPTKSEPQEARWLKKMVQEHTALRLLLVG